MRNLKKVLSLSLALVMLLGMMVVGAGAATTYTDADDITYTEAVDVMSAVGVFNGTDAGDFQPNGDLTREQAAKIICYMLMGQTAADALSTNTAPFQDVAANRWSAGSIAYCVTMGIVAGDGNGKFYPTQTVTGYQFAKMLLVALGYDATVETYTGTNWAINVASDAASADLTVGLDASLTNTLTREQACQMAFNAMKADMVNYSNKGTNITINGVTIAQGASDAEPVVSSKDTISDDGYLQFAEQYCSDLVLTASNTGTDAFGRPANIWTYNDEEVGTYSKTANFTYTADTGSSALSSALRGYTVDAVLTVNGDVQTGTLTSAGDIAEVTGNGTVVELFANKKVITDVVVIETEYATVSRIVTTSGKEAVNLTGGVQITLEDEPELYNVISDLEVGDAVLLVADADDNALAVSIPETVSGEFTRINSSNNTYTVGGTAYGASEAYVNNAESFFDSDMLAEICTLTLDNYGYVIHAEKGDTVSNKNYAMVLDTTASGNVMSGVTHYAQILFTDGTVEWVEVTTLNSRDVASDRVDLGVDDHTFVSYTEKNDGTYSISTVTSSGGSDSANTAAGLKSYTITDKDITRGTIKFLEDANNISGTGATVFLVENNDHTFRVYTGIRNVPNYTEADGFVLVNGTVARVVVLTASTGSTSTDLIYIAGAYTSAHREGTATVYTYPAVVNGEITTVDSTNNSLVVGAMYDGVVYTDGVITAANDPAEEDYDSTQTENEPVQTISSNVFEYSNGVLTIGNSTNNQTIGAGVDTVTFYAAVKDGVNTITAAAFNALSKNAVDEIAGTADLVVVYDEDGFVTEVYVSYNEPGEKEEVSTGALSTVVLEDAATDGQMTVTVTTTTEITGTVTLSVQEYMRATDTYVQVKTADITFSATNTGNTTLTGLTSGTIYRVVATYGNGTMTSESAACIAN